MVWVLLATMWMLWPGITVSQKVDDLPDVIKLLQFEKDESLARI